MSDHRVYIDIDHATVTEALQRHGDSPHLHLELLLTEDYVNEQVSRRAWKRGLSWGLLAGMTFGGLWVVAGLVIAAVTS